MADEKEINPGLKSLLELGPPIAFFVVYLWIRDETYTFGGTEYGGFIVAAVAFVPILLASIAALWWLTGKISRMQVFTALMVIVFGGLTAWFNDGRFFMMKTTLVYGTMAALLGIGLMRGQSWLEWAMGDLLPMEREGWMIFTRRVALLFAILAVANEVVWRTQTEETWVIIETFVFPAVLIVALFGTIMSLQKYLIDTEEPEKVSAPGDNQSG